MPEKVLRDHLVRLLDWEDAHVGFDKAIDGIPADKRGARTAGFEHSPWQLLEHIRIAQEDILDFCVNSYYEHRMKWPDDYWPAPGHPTDETWNESVAAIHRDTAALATFTIEDDRETATYSGALLRHGGVT